ncbi:antibiotic biosynthesis monooxygenase [Acinetobacter qingfengensis]|uniref:ABM domain-containing protein n=1 Tax=Acinetobacter qingfengensis TaxID=1262585 RepID=A0A1E7R1T4_9GAMM|nr:putative quinol monooxygenase [Acinetobacter qingfengensis]KAA8734938.1 antibiotic biosynthesis monooxygenase [Acinetobacter qingfengensis]OEY93277.1 hypothetical protein BJI46_14305 [Acinetobacter qingfengensis]
MIILNVFFTVKPEQESNFRTLMTHLVSQSQKEPGNVHYQLAQDVFTPHHYTLIEHWKDDAAIEFHNQTEHFLSFLNQASQLFSEDVVILKYINE